VSRAAYLGFAVLCGALVVIGVSSQNWLSVAVNAGLFAYHGYLFWEHS